MYIAVYGRVLHSTDRELVQELLSRLEQAGFIPVVFEEYLQLLREAIPLPEGIQSFKNHNDILGKAEYMVSIGGDGTILDTLTHVRNSNIPILGINTGRLGFLAGISREEVAQAVEALRHKSYVKDTRTLIHLDSNRGLFGDVPYALNEFTIHKKDTSSMIIIHTYLNGEWLNSYWADGLIVSTPTGSTGYSLSCGGPIIFPSSENFVITPVAPHNLNVRPIVVSGDSIVSFTIEGRAENFQCTLDSRFETIDAKTKIAVRKEDFTITLLSLNEVNFLKTLQNKLMWGADKRN